MEYGIHLYEKYDVCACEVGKSHRRIHIRELSNAPCWPGRIRVDSGQKFCFDIKISPIHTVLVLDTCDSGYKVLVGN